MSLLNITTKKVRAIATSLLVWSITASAWGGPLEINQSCAVAASGCFPGDAPGFPVQITTPGSYVLTGNLDVPALGLDAIELDVNLSNLGTVSLDLRGFAVRGPATCQSSEAGLTCSAGPGTGVRIPFPPSIEIPLQLSNGEISGFPGTAVVAGRRALLRNLNVHGNGKGIVTSSGSIIENCVVERNGGNGIEAFESIVYGSAASENNGQGVIALRSIAERSSASENGIWGIQSASSLIREVSVSNTNGSAIRNNAGWGLLVDSAISGSSLYGIQLFGGYAHGNTIRENDLWGIHVAQAGGSYGANTLSGNTNGDVADALNVGFDLGENVCSGVLCP